MITAFGRLLPDAPGQPGIVPRRLGRGDGVLGEFPAQHTPQKPTPMLKVA